MTTTTEFTGQQFATEFLVSDTVAYDVVEFTAKTIVIRRRRYADRPAVRAIDRVYCYETESRPTAATKRLRLRKDGTYRTWAGGHPLQFTDTPPVARVNYAF